MKMIERISAETGEHAFLVQLMNVSTFACSVRGYPTVSFADVRGQALPLRVQRGSGPYVTGRPPALVALEPGDTAFVEIAKYRCDIPAQATATTAALTMPGTHRPVSLSLRSVASVDACNESISDVVYVSPVVATEPQLHR